MSRSERKRQAKTSRQRRDYLKRRNVNRRRQQRVIRVEEVKVPKMVQEKVWQKNPRKKGEKILVTVSRMRMLTPIKPEMKIVLKKVKAERVSLDESHPNFPHPKSRKIHPKKVRV